MISKQFNQMENRMSKALVKFNLSLSQNKRLREQIDMLRKERVVFDHIYKKLEKELNIKKKEMASIIEQYKTAQETREKAQAEMKAMKDKMEKEKNDFEKEWRDLGKMMEADRKARESIKNEADATAAGNAATGGA